MRTMTAFLAVIDLASVLVAATIDTGVEHRPFLYGYELFLTVSLT